MSRSRPWSLRRRLLAWLAGTAALLFIADASQNYLATRAASSQLLDDSMRETAGLMLQLAHHELAEHGQMLGIELLRAETNPGPYGFQFQIWTRDMQAGYRSNALSDKPLMSFEADGFGWADVNGERWRTYAAWSDDRSLQIQIAQPQSPRKALNKAALVHAAMGALLLLALTTALIVWILARTIWPLQTTARSVSQRGEHDLRPIAAPDAPEEVLPLVAALNRLLERISQTLQRERRFTADAAHELRTPLAAIRANAQVLVGAQDQAEREITSRNLIVSVDRSARLVEQLLSLARADSTLRPEAVQQIDLAELAASALDAQRVLAQERGITLLREGGHASMQGDRALLAVLLRNLLENALRHTPRGGVVTVRTRSAQEQATIEVIDTGDGVQPEERERIFRRFHRAPQAASGGSGLGLSICARIAELHNARIDVLEGESGRGACFRVVFPAPPARSHGTGALAPVIAAVILALSWVGPAQPAHAAGSALLAGRVLRVIDGDTVDVRLDSGRIRVRLQGIDAPERDQPGGAEATGFLARRLQDRDVLLKPVSQDQYDRLVAIIYVADVNMNSELVREGHAWAYRRYMRREERELCRLEHEARRSGRGLWQPRSAPARAPWEHRATGGRGPFTDFARSELRDCLRAIGRRAAS